jgi:hypothetical protein
MLYVVLSSLVSVLPAFAALAVLSLLLFYVAVFVIVYVSSFSIVLLLFYSLLFMLLFGS